MSSYNYVILYAFGFVLASIILQQVLPFPFGLYSGLLVFAAVPLILRKWIRDTYKRTPEPVKS